MTTFGNVWAFLTRLHTHRFRQGSVPNRGDTIWIPKVLNPRLEIGPSSFISFSRGKICRLINTTPSGSKWRHAYAPWKSGSEKNSLQRRYYWSWNYRKVRMIWTLVCSYAQPSRYDLKMRFSRPQIARSIYSHREKGTEPRSILLAAGATLDESCVDCIDTRQILYKGSAS